MTAWPHRLLAVTAAALLLAVAWQPDAQAHTRTQETTNLTATITDAPSFEGVSWEVHTGGLAVEVANHGQSTLIVEGYEGEPYLRIGPDGVEHNRRSAATYLNEDRYGEATLPPAVDPDAPADWVRVSDEPRAVWHDHRVHWMSPRPPDFVETNALSRAVVELEFAGPLGRAGADEGTFSDWEIPLTYDGEPASLEGELAWHDAPAAWPWLVLALLLVAPGLLGLRREDPTGRLVPAAVVVGLVAAVNGIHLVDDLLAFPGELLDELFGLLHTSTFLLVGLVGAAWAIWVDTARRLALGIAAGGVLYHQGLVHLPMLAASQFPTLWPDGLVRLTVALGLVQGGMVAVVLLAGRRARAAAGTQPTAPESSAVTAR